MFKKSLCIALLLSLILSGAALAEVTNRDMQLQGGLAVSNEKDTFFFCPMEPGLTKHWGLYKASTAAEGPIVEVKDGFPARLVHADADEVFFLGYTDAARTLCSLYSVKIASGENKELLKDIKAAYVGTSDTQFYYVTQTDPYTLRSYSIKQGETKSIKDMSKTKKMIYDAVEYNKAIYFLTKDEYGNEDGYKYNETSKKATNLDVPKPKAFTSLLYDAYRIYSNDMAGQRVYSVKIGGKSGVEIGQKYMVSLSSPRFGDSIFAYDGEGHRLVALPLDGSPERSISLEGETITQFVLSGSAEELYFYENGGVYALPFSLGSQTRLFDVDGVIGGQMWTNIVPCKNNMMLVMGYGPETLTNRDNMMPTGVNLFDRATGQLLFGYPAFDPNIAEEEAAAVMPEAIGDIPQGEKEEGDTYFDF